MQKRVIINRGDTDVRIAFLEDGKLVEFHRESLSEKSIVGNIYRGVVQDVVPGLQAAFIDVGMGRNVFLHFMDVRPESLVLTAENLSEALEEASKEVIPGRIQQRGRRPRPDPRAHDVPPPLKKGDTIIVQIIKAEINDKAPRVTTNLTFAGRYLVLLPYPSQSGGVSRRVAMGQERVKLKKLLHDLKTDDYSFIVRTAGVGADEDQIRTDVEMLTEQWDNVLTKFRSMKGPGLVYSDQDIVARLVRDVFTDDIDEIICDDADIADALRLGMEGSLPKLVERVADYDGTEPIFQHHMVELQLRKALHRKVWLKSGGYLIIDEMEALTAIDVNTGRFTGAKDQERTTFRTNMEACDAVAQQIRLRDIGGIIVIDFIDMLIHDNQTKVADELRRQLRHDRAKNSLGRIGDFGLMVLTRKRKHQSLQKNVFDECPYCNGDGLVLKPSEVWRRMRDDLATLLGQGKRAYSAAVITCAPRVAALLKGDFLPQVARFEELTGIALIIRDQTDLHTEDFLITGVEKPRHGTVQLPKRRLPEEDRMREDMRFEDLDHAEIAELSGDAARGTASGNPDRAFVSGPAPTPAEPGSESDAEETEEERRRTRRGRRGGRRRRGRGGEQNGQTPQGQELQKTAAADSPDDAPAEAPAAAAAAPAPAKATGQQTARPPRPPRPPRQQQPQAESAEEIVLDPALPAVRPARPPRPPRQTPTAPAQTPTPPAKAPVVAIAKPAKPQQAPPPAAGQAPLQPRSKRLQVLSAWGGGLKPPTTPVVPKKPQAPAKPAAPAQPEAPREPRQLRSSVQVLSTWGGGTKSPEPLAPGETAPARPSGPIIQKRAPSRAERRAMREEADAAINGTPAPTPAAKPTVAESPAETSAAPKETRSGRKRSRKSVGAKSAAAPAPAPEPAKAEAKPAAKKAAKKAAAPKAASPKPAAPAKATEAKPVKKAAKKTAKKAAKKAATPAKVPASKPAASEKKPAAKKARKKAAAKKATKKAAKKATK